MSTADLDHLVRPMKAVLARCAPVLDRLLQLTLGKRAGSAGELLKGTVRTVCIRVANADGGISIDEATFYRDLIAAVFDDRGLRRLTPLGARTSMLMQLGKDIDLQPESMPALAALEVLRKSSEAPANVCLQELQIALWWAGMYMATRTDGGKQAKIAEIVRLIPSPSASSAPSSTAETPEVVEAARVFAEIRDELTPVLLEHRALLRGDAEFLKVAIATDFCWLGARLAAADSVDMAGKVRIIRRAITGPPPPNMVWLLLGDVERLTLPTLMNYQNTDDSPLRPEVVMVSWGARALAPLDRALGTSYVAKYTTALFRFGNLIARADGAISEAESAELRRFIPKAPEPPHGSGASDSKPDATPIPAPAPESLEATLKELEALIGLAPVKAQITRLTSFVRVQSLRRDRGLKDSDIALHTVFSGNPGTGKTTVARLLAKIYRALGVISKGHLVETDRAGLVASYIGQTAPKTAAVIDSAKGGVLFIDEAYSLAKESENDFGKEAVETLLKRMEDLREDMIVIVAGYTDNMASFLGSNPGLTSRFVQRLDFPDYSAEELELIFLSYCKQQQYALALSATEALRASIDAACATRDKHFGNARYVRNLFERVITNQALRVVELPTPTTEALTTIESVDIEASA